MMATGLCSSIGVLPVLNQKCRTVEFDYSYRASVTHDGFKLARVVTWCWNNYMLLNEMYTDKPVVAYQYKGRNGSYAKWSMHDNHGWEAPYTELAPASFRVIGGPMLIHEQLAITGGLPKGFKNVAWRKEWIKTWLDTRVFAGGAFKHDQGLKVLKVDSSSGTYWIPTL